MNSKHRVGIYSGDKGYATYENGDRVYSVQVIFSTNSFSGEIAQLTDESHEHRFFLRGDLPLLHQHQLWFIDDWFEQVNLPVVKRYSSCDKQPLMRA
ncbi:hypothetical protein [Exiguobacterium sp. BG5(2022)]|uniref:hypothetical protein n=1 Tax=Exiguobacterium sp. BG5(2022) TaxID=2962595 RepID=UPI0028819836|nr:hypothetical protein [Exiguobacterium sp. BG5(2022)]MDT0191567.1 hypothetical protein [Exiguobacterium sp. BG5(2022)]